MVIRNARLLPARRRRRGQAIVLAALTMLVLALMIALSFNLSQALHNKVQLQQHSDAMAFAMATTEARALNYFAYTNRSQAAAFAAATSLHGYMSAAGSMSEILDAAKINFIFIALQELSRCSWTRPMCCVPHPLQAFRISRAFGNEARTYRNRARNMEGSFRTAMQQLDLMIDATHVSQDALFLATSRTLLNGNGLDRLRAVNAPHASTLPAAVGALNEAEFACAIDGLPCVGRSSSSVDTMRRVMTEVANATRPELATDRTGPFGLNFPTFFNPQFVLRTNFRIQSNIGISTPVPFLGPHEGTAALGNGLSRGQSHGASGRLGTAVSSSDHGWLGSVWRHGIFFAWPYGADVASNASGHRHTAAHQGGNHRFEGVNMRALTSCIGQGNCFMKFRASPDASIDYGQPHVYSYVTQDLRLTPTNGNRPWELSNSGTLTFTHGANGTETLTLAPGTGMGLSKAMVYYHRLGDWRDAPNLFNPYWRVKLHPFTRAEATKVLTAAGNTDAVQILAAPALPKF